MLLQKSGMSTDSGVRETCVQITAPLLSNCVTLGKLQNFEVLSLSEKQYG